MISAAIQQVLQVKHLKGLSEEIFLLDFSSENSPGAPEICKKLFFRRLGIGRDLRI
jgi:hypothetical protein